MKMGLFDLFGIRRRRPTRPRRRRAEDYKNLVSDIQWIRSELDGIHVILCRHDQDIGEQSCWLKKHDRRLERLVDSVLVEQTNRVAGPPGRPHAATMPVQSTGFQVPRTAIDEFTVQEKRILAAFFEHRDMALSYRDIARMLNKSPNTIKNQMHQIVMKTDLFQRTVDSDQRSRFKLKEGLKIEKYLTNRADQSV